MAMILFCIINYYYHAITYTKTTESRLCHSSKKSFVSKELSLFPAETATRCSRFSIVWKFMNLSPIQSMSLLTTMHYSIILLCNNSESPFLLRFITGKYIRYPLRTCFFFKWGSLAHNIFSFLSNFMPLYFKCALRKQTIRCKDLCIYVLICSKQPIYKGVCTGAS